MKQRDRKREIQRWLGLLLGCVALFLPPSLNLYLPIAGSTSQPLDEEESRSPVETTKITVGAIHREQDRRERPQPILPATLQSGTHFEAIVSRSFSTSLASQAFDSHNGLGGPLIV